MSYFDIECKSAILFCLQSQGKGIQFFEILTLSILAIDIEKKYCKR